MQKKKGDLLLLVIVVLFWFAQYVFVPFLSPHLTALGMTASVAGMIMGAYGMAQSGASAEEIVTHYFKGVTVEKLW